MPAHKPHGDFQAESLAAWRAARGISLRSAARLLGVSPQTLQRYERGERAAPDDVLDRLRSLTGALPGAGDAVLEHVRSGAPRSLAALRRSLPASLRPALELLVEAGKLGEDTDDVMRADGRRYVRHVVAVRLSRHERGLDRAAPVAVTGTMLRAAKASSGRSTAVLAHSCGVTAATWRSWEARGVPRARVVDVGKALGAPDGSAIRALREAAGWSQTDLAKRVGVRYGVVQGWETSTRPVPAGRVAILLAALDSAAAAAVDRRERLVGSIVDDIRSRPGVSESHLRHEHRQSGGRVTRDGSYAEALDDAKRRGLVVESLVTETSSGYPKSRTGLFAPGQAPDRVEPMTGDELGRRRTALELTQAELAELCDVSPVTVLHWEQCRAGAIPAHGAERAPRALALAQTRTRPSEVRSARLLELIGTKPGIAKHRLWGPGAGDTETVDRDLAALEDAGNIVRSETFDRLGRRYPGFYLAGAELPALVQLSGDELRRRREAAGWSQLALTAALGVGSSTVSRWESGDRGCPPARTAEILRVLETPAPVSGRDERILARDERILDELVVAAGGRPGAMRTELGWPGRRRHIERALELGRLRVEIVDVLDKAGRAYRRELLFPAGVAAPSRAVRQPMPAAEVRERRARIGLSQARLGALLGVANVTVSGWERGRVPIPPRHAARLRELSDGRELDRQSDRLSG